MKALEYLGGVLCLGGVFAVIIYGMPVVALLVNGH